MNINIINGLIVGFYFINKVSSSASIINLVKITNGGHVPHKPPPLKIGRIINGLPASLNQFPYQVILLIEKPEGQAMCGGTILDKYHIVTAAHCVVIKHQVPNSAVKVLAGHVNYKSPKMRTFRVLKIIVHNQFSKSTFDYDIAVLKLAKRLPLGTPGFKAISRLEEGRVADGTKCIISGWGTHDENERVIENHLYYTYLYHVNTKMCSKLLEDLYITPRMTCFGYKGKPTDSCYGDSGGPLVCNDTLVGIVSWSLEGCALPNNPGVYTNISNLRSWILTAALF